MCHAGESSAKELMRGCCEEVKQDKVVWMKDLVVSSKADQGWIEVWEK